MKGRCTVLHVGKPQRLLVGDLFPHLQFEFRWSHASTCKRCRRMFLNVVEITEPYDIGNRNGEYFPQGFRFLPPTRRSCHINVVHVNEEGENRIEKECYKHIKGNCAINSPMQAG